MNKEIILLVLFCGIFLMSCAPSEEALFGEPIQGAAATWTYTSCIESDRGEYAAVPGPVLVSSVKGAQKRTQEFIDKYQTSGRNKNKLREYSCTQTGQFSSPTSPLKDTAFFSCPNGKKTARVNSLKNPRSKVNVDACKCLSANDCSAGQTCQGEVCVWLCGNGQRDAGETCSSCPEDYRCAADQVCRSGACVVNLCGNGQLDEGESCSSCPADARIGLANEQEVCDSSDNNCNGQVDEGFDFQNDVNNCGRCANVCPAGNSCLNGACTPPEFVAVGSSGLVLTGGVRGDWLFSNVGGPIIEGQVGAAPGAAPARGLGPGWNDVYTLLPSHLQWVVGDGGKVFKKVSGRDWEEVAVSWDQLQGAGSAPHLNSVYFVNEQVGWVIGEGGIILKTTSGGAGQNAWVVQHSPANQPAVQLNEVLATDSQKAVVVGSQGKIFRTTNGGTNWLPTTTGVGTDLLDVFMTSSSNGWAVGSQGTVLYTTNSGDTWTARTPAIDNIQLKHLHGIYFVDQSTGWMVGSDGFILRTTDSGTHWEVQGQGVTSYALTEVYFVNAQRGCAVGAQRTVVCTSDGGLHWERRTPESDVLLSGISSS